MKLSEAPPVRRPWPLLYPSLMGSDGKPLRNAPSEKAKAEKRSRPRGPGNTAGAMEDSQPLLTPGSSCPAAMAMLVSTDVG